MKNYDTLHHLCLLQMPYTKQSSAQLFIVSETSFRYPSRTKLQLFIVRASRRPWFQSLIMNNLQHLDQISIWTQEIRISEKRKEKIQNEAISIAGKMGFNALEQSQAQCSRVKTRFKVNVPQMMVLFPNMTILRWR